MAIENHPMRITNSNCLLTNLLAAAEEKQATPPAPVAPQVPQTAAAPTVATVVNDLFASSLKKTEDGLAKTKVAQEATWNKQPIKLKEAEIKTSKSPESFLDSTIASFQVKMERQASSSNVIVKIAQALEQQLYALQEKLNQAQQQLKQLTQQGQGTVTLGPIQQQVAAYQQQINQLKQQIQQRDNPVQPLGNQGQGPQAGPIAQENL